MIRVVSLPTELVLDLHSIAKSITPFIAIGDHVGLHFALENLSTTVSRELKLIMAEIENDQKSAAFQIPLPLELHDLEPTPQSAPTNLRKQSAEAIAMLLIIARALGQVFTYERMKQSGRLFQHIFPIPGMESSQTAASSLESLDWHTEHSDKEISPDWLAILCLKNPAGVGTSVSRPQIESLPKNVIPILNDAASFRFQSPEEKAQQPVLEKSSQNFLLRYDPLHVHPRSKPAKQALDFLAQEIEMQGEVAPQIPGSIVIIPNRHTVHGRDSFPAAFDGNDRWLIRCFVAKNERMLPSWKI